MADNSVKATERRSRDFHRRWIGLVGLLIALPIGVWLFVRRTPEERLLTGIWTETDNFDDGSTVVRTWELRPDRTVRIHNRYDWVKTSSRDAKVEIVDELARWSCREGRLVIVPIHPIKKQLRVEQAKMFQRLRNMTQGKNELIMDWEGSNGRLTRLTNESFSICWWNPETGTESVERFFMRTKSMPTISSQ